jgi:glycosyltransferase involved in cell wall biosynthesis
MRFICLLPVRDEADIIGQCLGQLLRWADEIHIFDTGSVDSTWEIVWDWAAKDKRIVLLKKDPVYFSETYLRGWMFHQARKKMRNGDWFLRVDADEFHHIPPPEFVKTRLRRHETIVWYQYYEFQLTQSDVAEWEAGRETLADRSRSIEQRRRWFTAGAYCEPRLCKYRETMRWPPMVTFPYNAGFVARERLPIRHYPHRDPAQLDRRCRLRTLMLRDPTRHEGSFVHWRQNEWQKFVVPDNQPGLRHWAPGTELPELRLLNHLAKLPQRTAQRIIHAVGLPLLDRLRPAWEEGTYPQKIPDELTRHLAEQLKE